MPIPQPQRSLNNLEDLLRRSPELERQLPVRPEEPVPQDCCGQSCTPCVFDIYQSELEDWARRCWWRIKNPGQQEEIIEEMKEEKSKEQALFSFHPNSYQSLKLISITPITADTNIYRFALPSPKQCLFLPVGAHVIMKGCYEAKVSTKEGWSGKDSTEPCSSIPASSGHQMMSVVRQYTPIIGPRILGYMDLMIKLYPHGKMSSHLRRLQTEFEKAQDVKAEFRGPYGLYTYQANRYADLLMLAAGTGLAPMAQLIEHIVTNDDDMTRVRLLFCCRKYEDILLKDRLDYWRRRWNFSICYVLSQWKEETDRRLVKYGEEIATGTRLDQHRITEEVLRLQRLEHERVANTSPEAPPPPSFQVLICGTKAFEKDMLNYLLKAGIVAKRIFRF